MSPTRREKKRVSHAFQVLLREPTAVYSWPVLESALLLQLDWCSASRGHCVCSWDVMVQFLVQDLFWKSQGKLHTGLLIEFFFKAVEQSRCIPVKRCLEVKFGGEYTIPRINAPYSPLGLLAANPLGPPRTRRNCLLFDG